MAKTLLETHVQKHSASNALGCLITIPILFAVFLGVNLFIGESELPREIRGTTPWFALGLVLSGIAAGAFWWRSRIRLVVVELDGVPCIEVYDPGGNFVLQGPFQLAYGWNTVPMPKGPSMTLVIVGIYKDGELELSLTETWGAVYGTPRGWPSHFALEDAAKAAYTAGGRSFLVELVEVLGR